jgi:hypothetical protein
VQIESGFQEFLEALTKTTKYHLTTKDFYLCKLNLIKMEAEIF